MCAGTSSSVFSLQKGKGVNHVFWDVPGPTVSHILVTRFPCGSERMNTTQKALPGNLGVEEKIDKANGKA